MPRQVCPWPRDVVREHVTHAIAKIGGPNVFRFIGPDGRRAVIAAACWDTVRVGTSIGGASLEMNAEIMNAIEQEFMRVAGIAEENGWEQGRAKAVPW